MLLYVGYEVGQGLERIGGEYVNTPEAQYETTFQKKVSEVVQK